MHIPVYTVAGRGPLRGTPPPAAFRLRYTPTSGFAYRKGGAPEVGKEEANYLTRGRGYSGSAIRGRDPGAGPVRGRGLGGTSLLVAQSRDAQKGCSCSSSLGPDTVRESTRLTEVSASPQGGPPLHSPHSFFRLFEESFHFRQ